MLACHACMRRCLQTVYILGPDSTVSSASRTTLGTNLNRKRTRHYATSSTSSAQGSQSYQPVARQGPYRTIRPDVSIQKQNRQQWLDSRGVRPTDKPSKRTPSGDEIIRKHLQYLKDPLKLAEFVRKTLRDGDFETALATVRAASKDAQCIVSWNHIIEWQMSEGKLIAAIKTFNEMKKRAQTPDAHTYTILFNGGAQKIENAKDSANTLDRLMSIYSSLQSEKSTIKPNVTMMNAVLKVCSRARNMDALFAIASQMPSKGIRAPDNLTYTTMINALRVYAFSDHDLYETEEPLTQMQLRQRRRKAILDARNFWQDITKRWMKGDIWIDEELVCSMGRMLLLGDDNDIDDILSLYQQAFDIPRQVPKKGAPVTLQGPAQLTEGPPTESFPSEQASENTIESVGLTAPSKSEQSTGAYARPGNNSLSLILKASLELKMVEPARKYWSILTDQFKVRPDKENYVSYLRVLRFAKASTETISVLQNMPDEDLEPKTFRISMSTCHRDRLNRHAFSNAGKVLDLMQNAIREPDAGALIHYLDLAITAPAYSPKGVSTGNDDPSKFAQGQQILRALNRLDPVLLNVKSILVFENPKLSFKENDKKKREYINDVLQLVQNMIRAYDILMNKAMVPREIYSQLTAERSKLAAFVTKHKHGILKSGKPRSASRPDRLFRDSMYRHPKNIVP